MPYETQAGVSRRPQPLPWLLVADAARARVFERDPENGALREIEDFVHPAARLQGAAAGHERGDLVAKGDRRTQYQPPTEPRDKERQAFARELASWLEAQVEGHRCARLDVLAATPFLGDLRAALRPGTKARLTASHALDLTAFDGAELERRVAVALAGAGPGAEPGAGA